MATVLVIDDNETIRVGLKQVIGKMHHKVLIAASGAQGLEQLKSAEVDFVVTDLKMEGIGGVEVLEAVAEHDPDCPTMIITAFGTVETAVEAMKLGAFDFLQKPFTPEVVRLKVQRALELRAERKARRRLESENDYLRAETKQRVGDLVGDAAAMAPIFRVIGKVAPTNSSVLIQGESGTGKELVAHAIHQGSRRAENPFIKVNCGALTDSLLESELFGHEKGAFTGAVKRRLGRFELADGGTLLLDEVGEVSPAMQLKLLRVLQEREFERVGGERTIHVDVRLISATNKDLAEEVRQGRFREDLYYRLHVIPIIVPPLRERRDDIALLTKHFIHKLAPHTNPQVSGIDDEALARLMTYGWPGNVRELENAIEQALVFADGNSIGVDALPQQLVGDARRSGLTLPKEQTSLPEILEDLERQLIVKAFKEANGVKTETARKLGIKTSALYYKLEKYGIS
ncbi:MAG: sigma-54-dependent Fis family transcriptional regulator [Deltaproteobacteria bacterium]|nr:sigma-54-dependent Fis family transcriptional regulator [Deltaproteobacteria bacterium]